MTERQKAIAMKLAYQKLIEAAEADPAAWDRVHATDPTLAFEALTAAVLQAGWKKVAAALLALTGGPAGKAEPSFAQRYQAKAMKLGYGKLIAAAERDRRTWAQVHAINPALASMMLRHAALEAGWAKVVNALLALTETPAHCAARLGAASIDAIGNVARFDNANAFYRFVGRYSDWWAELESDEEE